MDEDEVIYIDEDERNAFTRRRRPSRFTRRPGSRIVVTRRPTSVMRQPPDLSEIIERRPAQVVVQQPFGRSMIAGFTIGELVEMAAQVIAAIQSLPTPPTAQGCTETDVENLVTYQTALAVHAKRDEQLRTLGNLVGRIVR